MIVAFYRVLYGEDYINASIQSIIDEVDKVVIFLSDKPWGDPKQVTYLGQTIKFPPKFDNTEEQVALLNNPKIEIVKHYSPTPSNQHKLLMEELTRMYGKIDLFIAIEPDMIHTKGLIDNTAEYYCLSQVEFWKYYNYRIPQRGRPGPIYYKKIPESTRFNGIPTKEHIVRIPQEELTYNMGFACSTKTMINKHLTALAFSRLIGDSVPNERWLKDVWMKWHEDMENLAISRHNPQAIPRAYRTTIMTQEQKDFIDENRARASVHFNWHQILETPRSHAEL
jgi:hypothetical protein